MSSASAESDLSIRERVGLILRRDGHVAAGERPTEVALPAVITAAQNAALAKLALVYGRVVPGERRPLASIELVALFEEHRTLDTVEKLAKKRKEYIRTTVLNHLDVGAETDGTANDDTPVDRAGHYLIAGRVAIAGADECFAWEITDPAPTVDFEELKALADNPACTWFNRADWVAITVQTRTFDETKAAAAIEANPGLLEVLASVSAPAPATGRFAVRPVK